MRAGRLRERIDLQSVSRSADSWGDAVATWSNYATSIPATITPASVSETTTNNAVTTEATHSIYIRYSSGVSSVSTKHRVKYGSRYFDIISVINSDNRNRMLELVCREVVS